MVRFTDETRSGGFELIPEGVTILRVKELKPVMSMGKINKYKGKFEDSRGRLIFNDYNVAPTNKYRVQAMRSLYSLLKKGCELEENYDGEIDESEAEGKYFVARVKHTEGSDGRTFQNLGYILGHVDGFNADISAFDDAAPRKEPVPEIDDPYA